MTEKIVLIGAVLFCFFTIILPMFLNKIDDGDDNKIVPFQPSSDLQTAIDYENPLEDSDLFPECPMWDKFLAFLADATGLGHSDK